MEIKKHYRENSQQELVILVNEKDEWMGTAEKLEVHLTGALHRALSVFITNEKKEILLQKRAANKYHSAGLWTNACCSHPRPKEQTESAARRRVQEELGLEIPLKKLCKIHYKIDVGEGKTEHEFDHIFSGEWNEIITPNPDEVSALKWIKLEALETWINKCPQDFTAWFPTILKTWKEVYFSLSN